VTSCRTLQARLDRAGESLHCDLIAPLISCSSGMSLSFVSCERGIGPWASVTTRVDMPWSRAKGGQHSVWLSG
jgi:hypothetical protein